MGQQQLLLLILALILVGIAIAAGISMYNAQTVLFNRDALTNDLTHLAAHAHGYRQRPYSMGGGQGSYDGYTIPSTMAITENGTFSVSIASVNEIVLTAVSAQNPSNTVSVTVDSDGRLSNWNFSGDFQ